MTEGRTYDLRHMRDLADVPIERLDDCLHDIKRLVLSIHAMRATLGEAAPSMPEIVKWQDDDDRSAAVDIRGQSDENLCSFSVDPAPLSPKRRE